MQRPLRITLVILIVALSGTIASAQQWRGLGRVAGRVTDESGKPIEGVVVKAYMPAGEGGTEVKTNRRGEWAIGGIASGSWQLDFGKDGYKARQISVSIGEFTRIPPIEITLEKAEPVVDPNVEIRESLIKAADLMNRKQFAEARQIYEGLLAKYPEAHQLHPLIARAYYGENQFDKSIEHLRLALEKDPTNTEIKLLLGNVLIEKGNADEGKQILASIDEAAVKDPIVFVNIGIVLLNQNKPADALTYLERTIARFPDHPDAYYYRGITRLQQGDQAGAKADLAKFLQMAPNAPEAAMARKILEQLK